MTQDDCMDSTIQEEVETVADSDECPALNEVEFRALVTNSVLGLTVNTVTIKTLRPTFRHQWQQNRKHKPIRKNSSLLLQHEVTHHIGLHCFAKADDIILKKLNTLNAKSLKGENPL